ncbi:hypothetical protein FHU14_005015 [Mesorhizobium sp. RMAD-H1]|nr:hypothetical protein [Mesorhizobium sp. RMAD-H1]
MSPSLTAPPVPERPASVIDWPLRSAVPPLTVRVPDVAPKAVAEPALSVPACTVVPPP